MIYFRADANPSIGMGHIMRCLSIADAFRDAGRDVQFVLADRQVEELIHRRGYEAVVLHSSFDDMESELGLWPEIIPELIIVDSYFVTESYLKALHDKSKLVYIDDLAAFPYPVDILINYNAYGPEIDYHSLYHNHPPELLLGVTYVPLRKMFQEISMKTPRKYIHDILFSTGGADDLHLALQLVKMRPRKYNYHVLIGAMNTDWNEIRRLAEDQDNIIIHENVSDMRSLITNCDVAISAAGSTLYEICACGIPLVTYITADNQISGAEAFEKIGLAVNCGDMRLVTNRIESLIKTTDSLNDHYDQRVSIVSKMKDTIDGNGAQKIVNRIL